MTGHPPHPQARTPRPPRRRRPRGRRPGRPRRRESRRPGAGRPAGGAGARRLARRLGVAAGGRPAPRRRPPGLGAEPDRARRPGAPRLARGHAPDPRRRHRQPDRVGGPERPRALRPLLRRHGHHRRRRALRAAHPRHRLSRRLPARPGSVAARPPAGRHARPLPEGGDGHRRRRGAAPAGGELPRQPRRPRLGRRALHAAADRNLHRGPPRHRRPRGGRVQDLRARHHLRLARLPAVRRAGRRRPVLVARRDRRRPRPRDRPCPNASRRFSPTPPPEPWSRRHDPSPARAHAASTSATSSTAATGTVSGRATATS